MIKDLSEGRNVLANTQLPGPIPPLGVPRLFRGQKPPPAPTKFLKFRFLGRIELRLQIDANDVLFRAIANEPSTTLMVTQKLWCFR